MRYALPALAVIAGAITACQPQPISQADEEAIRAVNTTFTAAVNAENVDAMTAVFTSDATVQPNGMPGAVGTAAIHKLFTDMMGPMRTNLRTSVTKIAGQGDMAYVTGTYHVSWTMKDSTQTAPPAEDGKWITVLWRQPDKSWKFASDTWNPNAMPAMPAPAHAARRH